MAKIVTAPDPVLSEKAKRYNFNDGTLSKLLKEMAVALESATDPKGVGLAAPQIGNSVAVFIARPTEKGKPQAFINPEILSRENLVVKNRKKKEGHKKLEGCLSLPNIWGTVERAQNVVLTYQDERGRSHTKLYKGFMATIVQHEVDHLEGILFPKHVLEQKGQLYQSHKNDEGEDEFDPIDLL